MKIFMNAKMQGAADMLFAAAPSLPPQLVRAALMCVSVDSFLAGKRSRAKGAMALADAYAEAKVAIEQEYERGSGDARACIAACDAARQALETCLTQP